LRKFDEAALQLARSGKKGNQQSLRELNELTITEANQTFWVR